MCHTGSHLTWKQHVCPVLGIHVKVFLVLILPTPAMVAFTLGKLAFPGTWFSATATSTFCKINWTFRISNIRSQCIRSKYIESSSPKEKSVFQSRVYSKTVVSFSFDSSKQKYFIYTYLNKNPGANSITKESVVHLDEIQMQQRERGFFFQNRKGKKGCRPILSATWFKSRLLFCQNKRNVMI